DTGASLPDGTKCGEHLVCSKGACVPDANCHPSVLVLGDGASGDSADAALVQALTAAGLKPTLVDNGASVYDGTLAASSLGAVLVTPGRSYETDMQSAGQQAIVAANAGGTGVVFTEWASFEVTNSHYQALAPLLLLSRSTGETAQGTFTLTTANHPLW